MTLQNGPKKDSYKILYIESDDEIADLCELFAQTKEKTLCLVFPVRSPLLLSKININLLLQKAKEAGKILRCSTKDPIGLKHLQDMQIPVEHVDAPLPIAAEETTDAPWWRVQTDRVRAWIGTFGIFGDTSLPKEPIKEDVPKTSVHYELRFQRPGKKILITLLTLSVALFLFIAYVAIPGATVYIDPQVASQTRSLNIIFADPSKNDLNRLQERAVPLHPLDLTFDREVTIGSTGQNFFGAYAKGTVTIFNNDSKVRPIVAKSRLQTEDGLLFLTDTMSEIPARTAEGPGRLSVAVTAASEDIYGTIIGERGNIQPTRFFFPALSSETQQILWAESQEPFGGGTTEVEKFVKDEDVEAARLKVEQELKYVAVTELNNRLAEINAEQGTRYVLFDRMDRRERIIHREVLDISVPEVAGEKLVSFQAKGTLKTRGWYYDQQAVYEIMRKHMEDRLSPTENLLRIDDRTMKFTTLFEDEIDMTRGLIKATVSIEGIISYNFFDSRTTLIRTIKQSIIGKSKYEAEKELNNLPQVKGVHIVTWPFWAPTLPTIQDNIEIVVRELE